VRVVSFSTACANLEDLLDRLTTECPVTVIRRQNHEDAVIMPLSKYRSMAGTMHLLSNKANRDHLAKSIAQFKAMPRGK